MLPYPNSFSLLLSFLLPAVGFSSTTVGAYWAFQTHQSAQSVESHTFSEEVSVNTLPSGTPTFNFSGTQKTNYGNFFSSFTAHDGSTWEPGRAATWDTNGDASTGNQFAITLDTSGLTALSVSIRYRLNGVQTSSGLMAAFASFEYQVDGGAFLDVTGVDLTLINDGEFNREWTADLSALPVIENAGTVTLRWTIPDLVQVSGAQIRMDDLEVTGVISNRVRYFPEQRYNVLFIAIDDLKPLIGAYGESIMHTPNMDTLAATGITFTNAHCQQAICNASRVSVMTGLRVDTTKTWDLDTYFRDTVPTVVTLPQHFKKHGYTTKAIGKIFHSTNAAKHDVPNSWSDGYTHKAGPHRFYGDAAAAEDAGDSNASSTDRGVFERDGITPVTDQHYNDGLNSDYAIAKLAEYATAYDNGNGTPFFLALGFQKPHLPFNSPDEYWALYDSYMSSYDLSDYVGDKQASVPAGAPEFAAPFAGEPSYYSDTPIPPTQVDARRLIHGYLACVSYVDKLLGEVLAALDAEGLTDSTIVVLWGDHGWHLNDHDGWWSKHTNYEQATRSPLIVRVPGMAEFGTAGAQSDTPMELVDIYPTLVELCGLPASPQPAGLELEGMSFMPLLQDVNQPWKKGAFSQYHRTLWGPLIARSGLGMGYTVRTERYRYTEWWRTASSETVNGIVIDRDEKLFSTPEFVELYDYAVDPGETINLATDPAYTDILAEMSALLAGGNGWSQAAVQPPADYPETFSDWQARHLIPGYAASDLAAAMDPDGDQVENILEYAMGTHPLNPDFDQSGFGVVGGNLVLDYDHVSTRTDVVLRATTVDELTTNNWTEVGVTTQELEVLPNRIRARATIPVGASETGFLRLEASQ